MCFFISIFKNVISFLSFVICIQPWGNSYSLFKTNPKIFTKHILSSYRLKFAIYLLTFSENIVILSLLNVILLNRSKFYDKNFSIDYNFVQRNNFSCLHVKFFHFHHIKMIQIYLKIMGINYEVKFKYEKHSGYENTQSFSNS